MTRPMIQISVMVMLLVAAFAGSQWISTAWAQEGPALEANDANLADANDPNATADPNAAGASGGTPWINRLRKTGWVGVVELILSVVGLTIILERLVNLNKGNIVPPGLARRARQHWEAGDSEAVKQTAANSRSTLGKIIIALVEHRHVDADELNVYCSDIASRDIRRHMQRSYPLLVIGTVAPLLGLLGTVIGMVGAFESVALAGEMGDPSIMAEDISFALMTTVVGLVVAVPALIAYHFFKSRTQMLSIALEEEAGDLLMEWVTPKEQADAR